MARPDHRIPTGGVSGAIALALAVVYLVWGSTYLAIRFAIETLPPFSMAGLRFLIAGGILYLFARLTGARTLVVPSDCGHSVFWCEATTIGAAVRQFIARR